jgi:hypothetical protein
MYLSAAAWAIGRTVVDPLILMVCFCPVETGALVVTGAAAVAWAAGVAAGAGVETVAAAVGAATGACVATVFVDPLPVHPAAIASMNTATRLRVIIKEELLFAFMVFDLGF